MNNKIINKEMSFLLYDNGCFGNKLKTWNNADDVFADDYCGDVTMRYASKYGKWCKYNVPQKEIQAVVDLWRKDGADEQLIRYNESAPDDTLLIQGEFAEDVNHRYILSYSTDKVKMRTAMELPEELTGNQALDKIKNSLSLDSLYNMLRLLNTYKYAVVEFSTYDHYLGNCPGNNTIFWEVRNY